ncbi:MAG: 4'-phosphopantetheinyl transferase superfamily protein [Ginsengibacter sp.]
MIHVFYCISGVRLDNTSYNYFLSKVPPMYQEEIAKFRKWEDRQHRVLGKMLLIKGLEMLKLSTYSLDQLQFTNLKRPYFNESIDFNISHSGKYVVCAISTRAKIGVDVEEIKDIAITDFTNEFSAEEMKSILSSDDSLHSFYSLWTKKEAFLKAIGTGLHVPLNMVHVTNNKIRWEEKEWFLTQLNLAKNYCAHVCADVFESAVQIREISLHELR